MAEKMKTPQRPHSASKPNKPAATAEAPTPATSERAASQRGASLLPLPQGMPSGAVGPMGGNGPGLQQLQQAAGNHALSRLMQPAANGHSPASADAAPQAAAPITTEPNGRPIEKAPHTPVARARAVEEAAETKERASQSDEPEYAQSLQLGREKDGPSTEAQPPTEAQAEARPSTEAQAAPTGEKPTEADQKEEAAKTAEKSDEATAELEEAAPETETEAEPAAEEAAVEEEVQEGKEEMAEEGEAADAAAAGGDGAAGAMGQAFAQVNESVTGLMNAQMETANLAFQQIEFAPRPEEKVKEPRTAFQAAQRRGASEALAGAFLARNVSHVQSIIAIGMTAVPRITAVSIEAKGMIDAAVVTNTAAVIAKIAAMREQASANAAATSGKISAARDTSLAAITTSSTTALAEVEKAYTDTKTTLDTQEIAQLGSIESLYQTWDPKYRATGGEVGDMAMAKAQTKANNWLSQRNGESSILDGPIHDNRLEARADAAKTVAGEYKKGLEKEADNQADNLAQNKPQVLDAIKAAATEGRTALDQHWEGMKTSLRNSEESAKSQIQTKADSLLAATADSLQTTLASLDSQEASQVARLAAYGADQKLAIDAQAAEAISALVAGTAKAVMGFNEALRGFVETAVATQAPDQQALQGVLTELQGQADVLALTVLTQLEAGIVASETGVRTGGQTTVGRINELGQGAVEQAQATGDQYAQSAAAMAADAQTGFTQLADGHQKTVDEAKTSATTGFTTTKDAITTTFTAISDKAKTNFTDGRVQLKNGLEKEGLNTLDADIKKHADAAADAVQPRWKKIAKWVITIAVVIAAVVLTIVTAGGAGPIGVILIGAAIGGLAGASIQVGHNLVDGKEWSDGVGKAFVVGAIGGAFGGLGGVLAKGVMNVGLKLATEVGIDVVGGVVGDLAVGNPITVEGVLLGAGIGAGIGGGLALGSALKGKIKIKPSIDAPTVKPDVSVPSPKEAVDVPAPPKPKPPDAPAPPKAAPDTPTPKAAAEPPALKAPDAPAPKAAPEAPKGKAPEGAPPPKSDSPDAAPSPNQKAHPDKPEVEDGIVAKQKTADGHEIKVTKDGSIVKCSECEIIKLKYADELAADPKLQKRLDDIAAIDDPKVKAQKAAELEADLQNKKAKVEGEVPSNSLTDKEADIGLQKASSKPKVETVEEFLARGGKVEKVPSNPYKQDLFWETSPDISKQRAALGDSPEVEGIGFATSARAGLSRPPRHHVFPQEHRGWFEARGMKGAQDIDRFTVPLEAGHHQAIHGGGDWRLGRTWSGEWNSKVMQVLKGKEAALGRELTVREIYKQVDGLMRKYGIPRDFVPYKG